MRQADDIYHYTIYTDIYIYKLYKISRNGEILQIRKKIIRVYVYKINELFKHDGILSFSYDIMQDFVYICIEQIDVFPKNLRHFLTIQ